jgi:hypothetical protein
LGQGGDGGAIVDRDATAATGVIQLQPYTSRQRARRSCPTREELLWRGRGEVAGDCTVTTEPSRKYAAIDRGPA